MSLTYRKIDYWCRSGYLRIAGPGSGVARIWTRQELVVAEIMGRLTEAGISLQTAAQIARTAAGTDQNGLLVTEHYLGRGVTLIVAKPPPEAVEEVARTVGPAAVSAVSPPIPRKAQKDVG